MGGEYPKGGVLKLSIFAFMQWRLCHSFNGGSFMFSFFTCFSTCSRDIFRKELSFLCCLYSTIVPTYFDYCFEV